MCHLMQRLLPERFEAVMNDIKAKIRQAKCVGLTTDLWTSTISTSFVAVTAHFWNSDEEKMEARTLGCYCFKDSHTGEAIADELTSTMQEFNILNSTKTITTDNGANVVKAVRLLGKIYIPCFTHKLNLVVMGTIASTAGMKELRDRVTSIVEKTKRSTSVRDSLEECEAILKIRPFKPL